MKVENWKIRNPGAQLETVIEKTINEFLSNAKLPCFDLELEFALKISTDQSGVNRDLIRKMAIFTAKNYGFENPRVEFKEDKIILTLE